MYISFVLAIPFHPGKSMPRHTCTQVLTTTFLIELGKKSPENEMSINKNFLKKLSCCGIVEYNVVITKCPGVDRHPKYIVTWETTL